MKTNYFLFLIALVLFSCRKDYNPDNQLVACFGYQVNTINDGVVKFTNCSENATHYLWEFGDGKTSTEKEPVHVFEPRFPFEVTLNAFRGNEVATQKQFIYDDIMVYKPNIYIYPVYQMDLCVSLTFPMGGKIVESIPDYGNAWCVNVNSDGRINEQYNYLFYESSQPNIFQYKQGWCIAKDDLAEFFVIDMQAYNFSDAEIKDFTDYWIPLLHQYEFYCIYPQTNAIIDQVIQLTFTAQPTNINRLFYGIVGTNDFVTLNAPEVVNFQREGFTVMEWGVILK